MRPIFVINNNSRNSETLANKIATQMDFTIREVTINDLNNIDNLVEQEDAALLIIGINNNKEIQYHLNKCRQLRVPYIFIKNTTNTNYDIKTILLPITNLEEEREKAPFASSFARHFNCPITIYQPNDYGSKAATNIEAIKNLLNTFNLNHTTTKGKKDSNNIELETAINNQTTNNALLIISASRDYGLDDIIFGPKERKIIKKTNIPTMLINPRGDLYALCD